MFTEFCLGDPKEDLVVGRRMGRKGFGWLRIGPIDGLL
jgi:hypothetical protein